MSEPSNWLEATLPLREAGFACRVKGAMMGFVELIVPATIETSHISKVKTDFGEAILAIEQNLVQDRRLDIALLATALSLQLARIFGMMPCKNSPAIAKGRLRGVSHRDTTTVSEHLDIGAALWIGSTAQRALSPNKVMHIMTNEYLPPKIWKWESQSGGAFSNINRPIAGATHEKPLPKGKHPLQLHSLATPNGVKVTVMLEELLAAGHNAEYDAFPIDIGKGEQFGSGFVALNPNSKIPAMLDVETGERLFESGSILLYLAEKYGAFLPENRALCMNWLFWQMGSAPYLGGGFGHFYKYAPTKIEYAIDRFSMETKRQLDVLDKHLADNRYMCGDEYSIADIAIWPWYGAVVLNLVYDAAEFLDTASYTHLMRWAKEIEARPAVQRGLMVNRTWGPEAGQLPERHDSSDFELRTQDKIGGES